MSRELPPPNSGFSLVEVLVALTILAIALPSILSVFADISRRTRETEMRTVAVSLAQSLLAEVGTTKLLTMGEETGSFGRDHRWHLAIVPYGFPEDQSAWAMSAFTVTATVSWGQNETDGSFSLTTLRLAAKDTDR